MPKGKLSMSKTREILRQRWVLGRSYRNVRDQLGVSRGAIGRAVSRAKAAGLDWDQIQSMSDEVLERRLDDLTSQEKLLKDTLVSAQALSEDLQRSAVKEAEVLIGEAEVHAEKILDAAHRRAAQLSEDIRDMRGARARLAAGLRACTEMHLAMIDRIEEDPQNEPAGATVSYLARSAGHRSSDT